MDISSLRERNTKEHFTVSELNAYIKSVFDNDRTLLALSVKGEISNFTHHRSGHLYFSLKDNDGLVRAVMFRSSAEKLKFIPQNGMMVIVRCSVSVYSRDGSYQLYVNSMVPDGVGELYLAYEQLKSKLSEEGLFSSEHKKTIPHFPNSVGVITSPTGAAVRDIINVIKRRFPRTKIYLYPSLVQGDGAPENLIEALDYFDKTNLADVIIIGRGGGSIEDLWAFNSEPLARRIYAMSIPVISAVGHETDFTICDFVSDLRAPTPSAAAELAVPDVRDVYMHVMNLEDRLRSALSIFVKRKRERLMAIADRGIYQKDTRLFAGQRDILQTHTQHLFSSMIRYYESKKNALMLLTEKTAALSPLSTLLRGYSVTEKEGSTITGISAVEIGDEISVRVSDGRIIATVKNTEKSNEEKYKV